MRNINLILSTKRNCPGKSEEQPRLVYKHPLETVERRGGWSKHTGSTDTFDGKSNMTTVRGKVLRTKVRVVAEVTERSGSIRRTLWS